jgi:8-oxo-dGTP pyrophosphatase MutT (NUDIX family)
MQVDPPTPFYRVAAKALIFDDQQRLLVLQNYHGEWELPGGGWEHEEVFEDCIRREIYEELGVATEHIGGVAFMYRGFNDRRGYMALRIAVPVRLKSYDFKVATEMLSHRFVGRDEFLELDFTPAEGSLHSQINKLWPPVG